MRKYLSLLFAIFTQTLFAQIAPGTWHGELILHDTLALPFNFEVRGQTATIINAEERIDATISQMKSDSILIRLPDFDAELHVKQTQDVLTGEFFNLSRNEKNIIPFRGTANTGYRFSDKPEKTTLIFQEDGNQNLMVKTKKINFQLEYLNRKAIELQELFLRIPATTVIWKAKCRATIFHFQHLMALTLICSLPIL